MAERGVAGRIPLEAKRLQKQPFVILSPLFRLPIQ